MSDSENINISEDVEAQRIRQVSDAGEDTEAQGRVREIRDAGEDDVEAQNWRVRNVDEPDV